MSALIVICKRKEADHYGNAFVIKVPLEEDRTGSIGTPTRCPRCGADTLCLGVVP